jgi:hypothetical protein
MAYSSLSDARTKLTDPTVDHNSVILYGRTTSLDTNNTFFTDKTLTSLAPAGNYVVATSFKSYYVTIGNNGKLTGAAQELMPVGTDTSWVNDKIWYNTGYVVNYYNGASGGTSLSLSNGLLTDSRWSTFPYSGGSKKWIIDQGTLNTSAITNIDVSAMKGYDIRLITGEWSSNNGSAGFKSANTTSAIIHLAPDPDFIATNGIFGNKRYILRPDYWIPSETHDAPSFFRRMPTIEPIKDRYGKEKHFVDMAKAFHDKVYPGYPSSHDVRTATRMNKGMTHTQVFSLPRLVNGSVVGYASEPDFVPYGLNKLRKLVFDSNDSPFTNPVAAILGLDTSYVRDNWFSHPEWERQSYALWNSLRVPEANRSTWTININGYTYTYAQANPYSWTTVYGSGTAPQGVTSPINELQGNMFWFDGTVNGARYEYDFETVPGLQNYEEAGAAWSECVNSAYAVVSSADGGIHHNGNPAEAIKPAYSIYGNGIYQTNYYGATGGGWSYAAPGQAQSNFTLLYSDYHDYYMNSTKAYTALGAYSPWYKGAFDNWACFYISNYQFYMEYAWYIPCMVHNYDISKKILYEIALSKTGNATDALALANTKRVMAYLWRKQEPIGGSDFAFIRKEVNSGGGIVESDQLRPEVAPSLMQSATVWGMAYCDGIYFWEFGYVGEEKAAYWDWLYNHGNDRTAAFNYFGDCTMIGKSSHDWAYIGMFQVAQNRDLIEAPTSWQIPSIKKSDTTFTSGTENYPVMLYNKQLPIARYKLSSDGSEALVLIQNQSNNGYTKATHTLRLPARGDYEFTVDTWGQFTTVLRLSAIPSPPPAA